MCMQLNIRTINKRVDFQAISLENGCFFPQFGPSSNAEDAQPWESRPIPIERDSEEDTSSDEDDIPEG